jgi:hypothetical protein
MNIFKSWTDLLDLSKNRKEAHNNTKIVWSGIYYTIKIGIMIVSTLLSFDTDIFSEMDIQIIGLIFTLTTALDTLLNPGSHYLDHQKSAINYRVLFEEIRNCESIEQLDKCNMKLIEIEKSSPDVLVCFNKQSKITSLMNPKLKKELEDVYKNSNSSHISCLDTNNIIYHQTLMKDLEPLSPNLSPNLSPKTLSPKTLSSKTLSSVRINL